jgi:hypothetical protein
MRLSWTFSAIACGVVFTACAAKGDSIAFSGAITQSTLDGTGPAVCSNRGHHTKKEYRSEAACHPKGCRDLRVDHHPFRRRR